MEIIIMVAIALVNMVVQSTILPYWTVFGYAPNTALMCVISIALIKGRYHGAFFGLAIGLLQDIAFGLVIGINGLIYFIIGYVVGMLQLSLNTGNKLVPALSGGLTTIVYNFLYFVLMFFLAKNTPDLDVLKNIISIEILYNSILVIFIHGLFTDIFEKPSLSFKRR